MINRPLRIETLGREGLPEGNSGGVVDQAMEAAIATRPEHLSDIFGDSHHLRLQ